MNALQDSGEVSKELGMIVKGKERAHDPTASSYMPSVSSSDPVNGFASLLKSRSHSFDNRSIFSTDDYHELRLAYSPEPQEVVPESISRVEISDGMTSKTQTKPSRWKQFCDRNLGLVLVIIAQVFATLMNITTRMLELEGNRGKGMHPFQILFARMSITCILSMLYMWYKQIPDFPFGAKGVRAVLVARGVGGFFGVFGLYWSLQYLPLSDATVLTFLAPTIACYACSKLLNESFTRTEQIGGFISLLGVILIARPTYIFSFSSNAVASSKPAADDVAASIVPRANSPTATDSERLAAVGMALIGACGAASAYTTIRWIGKRAHPLISVNYFATWCTIVSTFALVFVPSIPFVLPATPKEWLLLFFIGVTGFAMQFLLTAGLRYEKSSRATNMVYSQMLFALAGDELVFGISPGMWSLAGSALILGSAIVVAIQKESSLKTKGIGNAPGQGDGGIGGERQQHEELGTRDEEAGLFEIGEEEHEEDQGAQQGIKMENLEHPTTNSSMFAAQDQSLTDGDPSEMISMVATAAIQEGATEETVRQARLVREEADIEDKR